MAASRAAKEDDRAAPEKRRKKKRRDGYSSRSSCLPEGERTVSQKNGTPFRIKANALLCCPGDYLVKGDCSGEYGPEHPIRYLAQEYDDVLTISTVSTRDFGSKEMQHWEIGGV